MAYCDPLMRFHIWQVFLYLFTFVNSIAAVCDICQENKAACVNSTSFHLCFEGNTPNRDVLYHCKDGFDCTAFNAICVQSSSSRIPSCGDTSLCGQCSAHRNYLFACQSRTTFQMCYGAQRPSGQIGHCPVNYICDASNDAICIHNIKQPTITCDVDKTESSETTISPPSSIVPENSTEVNPSSPTYPLTPNDICAQMREVGLFPSLPKDPFCKRVLKRQLLLLGRFIMPMDVVRRNPYCTLKPIRTYDDVPNIHEYAKNADS